uniref:NADH dehydrogenase [ubiquinone] 1 alpha subcomplex assembly factor 3 n=1 Tax=Romanomermis culicivorax TaxID=13658 RepID=A0A915J4G0_ROMCU
ATRGEYSQEGYSSPQCYTTSTDDNYPKTTATFLKDEMDSSYILFTGVNNLGFRLKDNTALLGPVAAFPKMVISWMVASVDDISGEALEFFNLLEPKMDVIFLGVGEPENVEKIHKRLTPYLAKTKLNVEILSSTDACASFNYLNLDQRRVAALLFPPDELKDAKPSDRAHLLNAQGDGHGPTMPFTSRELFGIPEREDTDDALANNFNNNKS